MCLNANITCIVVVLDLHGGLGCAVAKTSVLLQQLQTFISVINWTPTVVRTQHFNRYRRSTKAPLGAGDPDVRLCLRCLPDINKEEQLGAVERLNKFHINTPNGASRK